MSDTKHTESQSVGPGKLEKAEALLRRIRELAKDGATFSGSHSEDACAHIDSDVDEYFAAEAPATESKSVGQDPDTVHLFIDERTNRAMGIAPSQSESLRGCRTVAYAPRATECKSVVPDGAASPPDRVVLYAGTKDGRVRVGDYWSNTYPVEYVLARTTECRSVSLDTLREHLDHYTFAADHSIGASAERNSAVEEFLKTLIAEHTDCGSVDGKAGDE